MSNKPMKTPAKAESRRNGVQSVETGMRVLKALADLGGSSGLGAIAQTCAMPPPQAHRYLQSLIAAGMARQDEATGHYALGSAALQIGLVALTKADAFALTERMIRGFAEDWEQTIQISALGPLGPTVVRLYTGRPPVVMSLKVGSVLPLLSSATGKAFLAYASDVEVADLIAREPDRVAATPKAVEATRRSVRAAGMAENQGLLIPGLLATAFPILDLQGHAVLVVTAIAAQATGYSGGEKMLGELARQCATISAELGWLVS
jgi:DNA-binding IclR family transcriptional regulator